MARWIQMQEDSGWYQYPLVEEGGDPTLSDREFGEWFRPETLEYMDGLVGWGRWKSLVSVEDREFGIRHELFTDLGKTALRQRIDRA